MNIILKLELCLVALTLRREEHIEVKLVKLSLLCNLAYAVRDFIGHHHHAWECGIGVFRRLCPIYLCPLFVGVRPVINLVFDELAGVYRPKRRTRQVEIARRGDGQERFIDGVAFFIFGVLFDVKDFVVVLIF